MTQADEVLVRIDRFVGWFKGQLRIVQGLRGPPDTHAGPIEPYRKLCCLSLIDALASIRFDRRRYPELRRESRARFRRFVVGYAAWDDAELVSIPILLERLDPRCDDRLASFVTQEVSKHSAAYGGMLPLRQVDLALDLVLKYCSTNEEKQLARDCRHVSLLWDFRNFLAHEARQPGGAFEAMSESDEPGYHDYVNNPKLRLLYPVAFFERLVRNAIEGMEQYLRQEGLDPYSLVSSTDSWRSNAELPRLTDEE